MCFQNVYGLKLVTICFQPKICMCRGALRHIWMNWGRRDIGKIVKLKKTIIRHRRKSPSKDRALPFGNPRLECISEKQLFFPKPKYDIINVYIVHSVWITRRVAHNWKFYTEIKLIRRIIWTRRATLFLYIDNHAGFRSAPSCF